jgi:intein/homing endonuclease
MGMNKVKIPRMINEDIAYLAGFISGDGHLCVRKDKHEYSIFCSGNLNNERLFYEKIIKKLFIKNFKIMPKTKIDKNCTCVNLVIYSKDLLYYFANICKVPIGAKSGIIEIPKIFEDSATFKKAFIRGFVDADFSICLKKRYRKIPYYPVISGTSKSKRIILQISDFLKQMEINHSVTLNQIRHDERFKNPTIKHSIDVYGVRNLSKWMETIGFRNSKYLRTIEKLKIARGGFEPPTFTPR